MGRRGGGVGIVVGGEGGAVGHTPPRQGRQTTPVRAVAAAWTVQLRGHTRIPRGARQRPSDRRTHPRNDPDLVVVVGHDGRTKQTGPCVAVADSTSLKSPRTGQLVVPIGPRQPPCGTEVQPSGQAPRAAAAGEAAGALLAEPPLLLPVALQAQVIPRVGELCLVRNIAPGQTLVPPMAPRQAPFLNIVNRAGQRGQRALSLVDDDDDDEEEGRLEPAAAGRRVVLGAEGIR